MGVGLVVEWAELRVEWVEAEVGRAEPILGWFFAPLLNGIKAVDSGTNLAMYLGKGGVTEVSMTVKSWMSRFDPLLNHEGPALPQLSCLPFMGAVTLLVSEALCILCARPDVTLLVPEALGTLCLRTGGGVSLGSTNGGVIETALY